MCLHSPPNHSRRGVLAFSLVWIFCDSVEHFLLRLPLDSFLSPRDLLHYREIIGWWQLGAGLVYLSLSLSDLIVNG